MKKPSLNFLILILVLLSIAILEAYSVHIVLQESSIQPLPIRESVQYFFSKTGFAARWAEMRSIGLSISGETVTSATVTWFRRLPPRFEYYVTITVVLRNDYGNTISSGSVEDCYVGAGLVTSNIDLTPDVGIDNVARVETSVSIGGLCWEPPWPIEPLEQPPLQEEEV